MVLANDFDNLTDKDIELLNTYFDGFDYQSSSHTFLANYIWRNTHKLSWQIVDGYLFVAGLGNTEPEEEEYFASFPLTCDGSYEPQRVRTAVAKVKEIFAGKGQEYHMGLVPAPLVPAFREAFGGEAELTHDRDDDDYVYLKSDLVTLGGRKLHQKKNHLNYFLRNTEFTYEEATPEMVPEIMDYVYSKNEYKLGDTPEEWKTILEMETVAIGELLKFVGKGLLSGVIRIGGKIEAVTLGEFARTNSRETVIVHVEKADDRIRGLYQAINNEFCKRLPPETIYVNREEDMGLENLRQTKLSYKPYKLAEKFAVTFR